MKHVSSIYLIGTFLLMKLK